MKCVGQDGPRGRRVGADLTENKPISEIFHALCFVGGRGEGEEGQGGQRRRRRRGGGQRCPAGDPHKFPSCWSLSSRLCGLRSGAAGLQHVTGPWLLRVVSAQTELTGEGRGLLSPPSAPSPIPLGPSVRPSVCLSALDPRRLELRSSKAAPLSTNTRSRIIVLAEHFILAVPVKEGSREPSEDLGISQKYGVIVRFIVNKYVRTRRRALNFITFEYIAPQRLRRDLH